MTKKSSKVPAFLFDLDGTLIDSLSACTGVAGSAGARRHNAIGLAHFTAASVHARRCGTSEA
jgi:beta-phosphoglucomutase-like phosphatase (HAD superfamily)